MNDELAASLGALHADAFGWALHCCGGNGSRAEDVLQNAYLKVLQGTATTNGSATLKTWWFGVIRFTAQEEFRRTARRESLLGRLLHQFLPDAAEAADSMPSPARQIELSERAADLQALLAQLPERQAEVLHLVFYQDLSLSEAAGILKLTVGSVRQHYERGKTRLRSLIQDSSHLLNHE